MPETMEQRESKTMCISDGEGGGGYSTPTRVPRTKVPKSDELSKETKSKGALGSPKRLKRSSSDVLPEGRISPRMPKRAKRRGVARLLRRRIELFERVANFDWGQAEALTEWELLVAETEAEHDQRAIMRRLMFD